LFSGGQKARLLQRPGYVCIVDGSPPASDSSGYLTDYEQSLFTRIVAVAERHGRSVKLLIVPSTDVFEAIAQTAVRLNTSEILTGESAKMSPSEQARRLGQAWERLAGERKDPTRLVIYRGNGDRLIYQLGPHEPDLSREDLDLIHRLWTDAAHTLGPAVRHRHVVSAALRQFEQSLASAEREHAMSIVKDERRLACGVRDSSERVLVIRHVWRDSAGFRSDSVERYHDAGEVA
jgi:hypothetical protein